MKNLSFRIESSYVCRLKSINFSEYIFVNGFGNQHQISISEIVPSTKQNLLCGLLCFLHLTLSVVANSMVFLVSQKHLFINVENLCVWYYFIQCLNCAIEELSMELKSKETSFGGTH